MTPIVAVLGEVRGLQPEAEIRFWCDKNFLPQAHQIISNFDADIKVESIMAGKLRRYAKLAWWRQLMRPFTIVLPNIRDTFKIAIGTIQSLVKLIAWRPDVIFCKGGFVCLPVGIAGAILGIPLVIHDSDAHPGLTNRILSRWARQIATGAPLEYYDYPRHKTTYTGIPVRAGFAPVSQSKQQQLKEQLGFRGDQPLVLITGGGLGARRINEAAIYCQDLFAGNQQVLHITGNDQYQTIVSQLKNDQKNYQVKPFISQNIEQYLQAADVVVARAGMTSLLELAALHKPSIIIPNAYLTGGHQVKNANVFASKDAIVVLDEEQFINNKNVFFTTVNQLITDEARKSKLANAIASFAMPNAAKEVAQIVIDVAKASR